MASAGVGDGELNPDKTIPNLLDACIPSRLSFCPLASPHDLHQAPISSSPTPCGVILEKFASWKALQEDDVTEHCQELEGLVAVMKTKLPWTVYLGQALFPVTITLYHPTAPHFPSFLPPSLNQN